MKSFLSSLFGFKNDKVGGENERKEGVHVDQAQDHARNGGDGSKSMNDSRNGPNKMQKNRKREKTDEKTDYSIAYVGRGTKIVCVYCGNIKSLSSMPQHLLKCGKDSKFTSHSSRLVSLVVL